ncbi:hypothetical protein ES703_84561 [subsurface metagenome]
MFPRIVSDSISTLLKGILLNVKAKTPANRLANVVHKDQNANDFDLDLEEIKSVKYEIANGVVTPVAVAAIILRTNKCQNSATAICNIATIDYSKPARTSNFFLSIISVK